MSADQSFTPAPMIYPPAAQFQQTVQYEEVVRTQNDVLALKAKMEYMGTKADLQELRADFNKSMREFQAECNVRFEAMESKLQNMLITLWVAMAGAALTVFGIILATVIGFPWEKFFAFQAWIDTNF